jgi:hypothetical protein
MSSPNPFVSAAAPELIAVLKSIQAFVANLGTDPTQVPIKFPGALQVLLGQIELQLPALAGAEFTTLQGEVNTRISGWISALQSK